MKKKNIVEKIIDGALNVLIVLLAMFLLISLYTAVQVKFLKSDYADFFGYSLFEVQTGSMHGTIEVGDWIVVKGTKDVDRNDIITYKHGTEFVTHRVVEIYKGSYVTKGDANNTKDDPIDREQVVGKVVHILRGFGVLRKIFFNPIIIVLLIIILYLFNLTFKTEKSEFDILIKKAIDKLKGSKEEKKKKKEKNDVPTDEEPMESLFDDDKPQLEETKEEIEEVKEEIVPEEKPQESEETIEAEEPEKTEEPVIIETETVEEVAKVDTEEEKKEEELSNTAVFRMIDINPEVSPEVKEEVLEEVKNINEEELSKTSFYRIISVDDDEEDEDYQEEPIIEKVIEEEAPKKTKKPSLKNIKLEAEAIVPKVKRKNINKKYMQEKINSKKAKNILDKTFMIKRIVYDEILDVLLDQENSYIVKSPMRKQFMEQYLESKFFGLDTDRQNIKTIMNTFSEELRTKYIRDERKVKTIEAYSKAFAFIDRIENKTGTINYRKEIQSFKKFDDKILDQKESDIFNIVYYSNDCLNEILEKLETKTFKEQYRKIENKKDLYGVALNHNIAFSKVYSNYIVDKTYTEGIVAEDKIAVLLNILMCKVTQDMMKHDYDSKYIVFIPSALYGKDKKLDKIVSTINNDYAKTHIYFLTTASNMIKNESDFNRLSKKGYHFAVSFNKAIKYNNKNLGYIYLADYYFIDINLDEKVVSSNLPKEITSELIKDNLEKKIGDYRGD